MKIVLSAIALLIGSLSYGEDINLTNLNKVFGGTEFTSSATAGTASGVLLKTMANSAGTIRTLTVNFWGMTGTATGKAMIGGTAATLKRGCARTVHGIATGYGESEIKFEWAGIPNSVFGTTSVYVSCSDASVLTIISTEGK